MSFSLGYIKSPDPKFPWCHKSWLRLAFSDEGSLKQGNCCRGCLGDFEELISSGLDPWTLALCRGERIKKNTIFFSSKINLYFFTLNVWDWLVKGLLKFKLRHECFLFLVKGRGQTDYPCTSILLIFGLAA